MQHESYASYIVIHGNGLFTFLTDMKIGQMFTHVTSRVLGPSSVVPPTPSNKINLPDDCFQEEQQENEQLDHQIVEQVKLRGCRVLTTK